MEDKNIVVENKEITPIGNELGIGLLLGIGYLTIIPYIPMLFLLMFIDIPDPNIWGQSGPYRILSVIAQIIAGLSVMVGMYFVSKPLFKKIFKSFNLETFKKALKYALLNYACIMCLNMIDYTLFGESMANANQQAVTTVLVNYPILGCFFTIIFAPLIEELIFRYYVFKGLEKKNIYLAYGVAALTFAAVHLLPSIGTPFFVEDLRTLPVYVAGGLVLCYAYHQTKNISVNIFSHMLYNAIAVIMVFAIPSTSAVEVVDVNQTTTSLTITVEENADMLVDVTSMEIYLYDTYRSHKQQEPIERIETNTETVTFNSLEPDTFYIIIINYEMNNAKYGDIGSKKTYIDVVTLK